MENDLRSTRSRHRVAKMDRPEYDDPKEIERFRRIKTILKAVGFPLLIIGVIVELTGLILFFSLFFMDDPIPFWRAPVGIILMAAGGFMTMIGLVMLWNAYIGKFAKYYSTEMKGAYSKAGDGLGYGFAHGARRAGAFNLGSPANSRGGYGSREVVKVRCRSCGYLDSEDARFCSKCGKRL
ncbi:MAG: hypothetical protein ACMUIE_02090 [Thermoplasmatota archaeon]